MVDSVDRQRLFDWLRGRGADDTFLSYLTAELSGSRAPGESPSSTAGLAFGRPERELVVEGLLFLACEPRVDERRLDLLVSVATQLGIDEDALAGLVQARLGVTERRLRAYAVLKLSLDATQVEIKATQRRIAKVLHPDRLTGETPEARQRAEKLLGG